MIVCVCVFCIQECMCGSSVNETARLLVFGCMCLYASVHVCRFHWGVWEQRLSISSAAVPAGKSLIIISWMMSLRHAPHSRPVAASLQHPSLSLSLLSPFSLLLPLFLILAFSFYSLSLVCAAYCSPSIFSLSLTLPPPPSLSLCLHHHSLCLYLIPWIWLTLFSLSVFFFLSLLFWHTLPFISHFLWSWKK